MRILILLAAVLSGCGDPAAPFVGTWNGTSITTVSANGKTLGQNSSVTIPISEDPLTGDLVLGDDCGTTAAVRGSGFGLAKPTSCVLPSSAGGCRSLLTMHAVTGALRDHLLTIAYDGAVAFDQCPAGGAPFDGTFKNIFTGSK